MGTPFQPPYPSYPRDLGRLGWRNLNFAPFLNLTRLHFYTRTAACAVAVMQHLEFPSLNQFEMDVFGLHWAEAEPLLHVLSRFTALSHIAISEHGDRDVQILLGNSLMPIRLSICFVQLRTLRFNFPYCCINLDNDLLLEAMSSWPHIRMLEFLNPQAVPAAAFRGLFTAFYRCPRLHMLDIPLDVVKSRYRSYGRVVPTYLPTALTSSDPSDAEAAARIVFLVLPFVDRVCPPGYECRSGVCLEVQRHLVSFRVLADLGRRILI